MKAAAVLLLMGFIHIIALGQASNMISISSLRQQSDVGSTYSRADIERLMKTAHTPEDFEQLADYFDHQAEMYAAKYEEEQKELDRLIALRFHARSYPAQLENTRNRMVTFKQLAHKYSDQASAYRRRTNVDTTKAALSPKPSE